MPQRKYSESEKWFLCTDGFYSWWKPLQNLNVQIKEVETVIYIIILCIGFFELRIEWFVLMHQFMIENAYVNGPVGMQLATSSE